MKSQEEQKMQNQKKWKFWIDRGGTFTDVVALSLSGEMQTLKLLSSNPDHYEDAALEAIRRILSLKSSQAIDSDRIDSVKMGTTVATNALLERNGSRTGLVVTQGLRDVLKIGYQNRARLFDLHVKLPKTLYSDVIEAEERISADGKVIQPLNQEKLRSDLQKLYEDGCNSIAIVFMHSYRFNQHEKQALEIARQVGFGQISPSFQISSLVKLVGRGDTTVADAYLNPILSYYVQKMSKNLGKTPLYFMQSNSGLTSSELFKGKDAILSGPAGGIVGMVKTAEMDGKKKLIGFDMGGTSTDVSHYNGEYERVFETVVSGIRLRTPMMSIHTVAAGGKQVA